MTKADSKLIEQAREFIPPRAYTVSAGAVISVTEEYRGNMFGLYLMAFSMGFIKGQRAARRATK